jgi:hypothetical protein
MDQQNWILTRVWHHGNPESELTIRPCRPITLGDKFIADTVGFMDALKKTESRFRYSISGVGSERRCDLHIRGTPAAELNREVNYTNRTDSRIRNRVLDRAQRTEPGIDGLARTNLRFS